MAFAFPSHIGNLTHPRNRPYLPARSINHPSLHSGQARWLTPQAHCEEAESPRRRGSETSHEGQAGSMLPQYLMCSQRNQFFPSRPRTPSSRPAHSPHSWTSSFSATGIPILYSGSSLISATKADGRDFEARIVRLVRARVIATYISRRSSAFSNNSASGDTKESRGSSTISEGKPIGPLSAFSNTT